MLVCSILGCSAYAAELEIKTVECGFYEQDGDLNNGPEPIEWIVLSETEDDMKLLLLKYCLDAMTYDVSTEEYWEGEWQDPSWTGSDLYKWLGSFQDEALPDIKIGGYRNEAGLPYIRYSDFIGHASILNVNAVERFLPYRELRMSKPTPYAISRGA